MPGRSGKMPTTSVRRRISLFSRSWGLLDQDPERADRSHPLPLNPGPGQRIHGQWAFVGPCVQMSPARTVAAVVHSPARHLRALAGTPLVSCGGAGRGLLRSWWIFSTGRHAALVLTLWPFSFGVLLRGRDDNCGLSFRSTK